MKNSERNALRQERSEKFDLFQGMLGFLKMAESDYHFRTNQILTKDLKEFDWKIFDETTEQARGIQEEANQVCARIWEIDYILMSNPNTREIMKSGGIIAAKLRARQIEKNAKQEIGIAQSSLEEWNSRVDKVAKLKKTWNN